MKAKLKLLVLSILAPLIYFIGRLVGRAEARKELRDR